MRLCTVVVAAAAVISLIAAPSWAEDLPASSDEVELTISGKIDVEGASTVQFDLATIEAMPSREIVTSSPWFDDVTTFEGVLVRDLLESVSAYGSTVVAVGINDYVSEIPYSDFVEHDAILAYKHQGEYMDVADKGPFFIVYPFDADPKLQSQMYYQRSVWQIRELVIE